MAGYHYNSDLCSTATCAECCGCEQYEKAIENFKNAQPTVTKADICREFKAKLKEYIDYIGVTPVIEAHRLYQILAEMEQE